MAELSAIPFNKLPSADDGYTVLYENNQVCRSEKKLSELVGDKTSAFLTQEQGDRLYQEKGDYLVADDITGKLDKSQYAADSATFLTAHQDISNKLDTTAFSTVSGNFLTAHQSLDEYATQEWVNNQGFLKEHQPISANEWNDVYETVVTNSGTWGTETNWTDDINAASAYAYEQAIAQIPSIDGLATETLVQNVSGEIADKIPDVFIITNDIAQRDIPISEDLSYFYKDKYGNLYPLVDKYNVTDTTASKYTTYVFRGITDDNLIKEYHAYVVSSKIMSVEDCVYEYNKTVYGGKADYIPFSFIREVDRAAGAVYPTANTTVSSSGINVKFIWPNDPALITAMGWPAEPIGNLQLNDSEYEWSTSGNMHYIDHYIQGIETIKINNQDTLLNISSDYGELVTVGGSTGHDGPQVGYLYCVKTTAIPDFYIEYKNINVDVLTATTTGRFYYQQRLTGDADVQNMYSGTVPEKSDYLVRNNYSVVFPSFASSDDSKPTHFKWISYFKQDNGDVLTDGDKLVGLKLGDTNYTIPQGGGGATGAYVPLSATDCRIGSNNINLHNKDNIFAQGTKNEAGENALAQGIKSTAYSNSLAQGLENFAETTALAQGSYNYAYFYSLAQGYWNSACERALAQGYQNTADHSLSQGEYNFAKDYSLAQGYKNYADYQSLAQGSTNKAYTASLAIGNTESAFMRSLALGQENSAHTNSFTLGSNNSAYKSSYAQGYNNSATEFAMCQGSDNIATECSFIQGTANNASTNSMAQGIKNTASYNSFAQGRYTSANNNSVALSYNCLAKDHAFAQGFYNSADNYSLAQGQMCYAKSNSFAQGNRCSAIDSSFAQGSNCYANSHAMSHGMQCSAYNVSFAQGQMCYATAYAMSHGIQSSAYTMSFAHGIYDYANNWSLAVGLNNSAYEDALALGTNNVASSNACAIGNNTSAASAAAAFGDYTTAFGGSVAVGMHCVANSYAQAFGNNVVIQNAMAIGEYNKITNDANEGAAFVIGNGTDADTRSDAFVVYKNGLASAANFATSGIHDLEAKIKELETIIATYSSHWV